MSFRLKHVLGLVALLALALAAWSYNDLREKRRGQEAKAEEQAFWISRVWNEGMNIAELRKEAEEAAGHPLDLSAWETGDGPWIARGQVAGQRRIFVMRDRSLAWRMESRSKH